MDPRIHTNLHPYFTFQHLFIQNVDLEYDIDLANKQSNNNYLDVIIVNLFILVF